MMPSKTKAARQAYWKQYRAESLPYKQKRCISCGAAYGQSSNGQKKCDACRTLTCGHCNKQFLSPNGHIQKFCSRTCKASIPEVIERLHKHRGVKPRTSLLNGSRRGAVEDREWRIKVFERDDYTCQICGHRGGNLEADHIKPFSAFPELRLSLENGRTLCVPCHKQTDTYGSRAITYRKRLAQEVLPL